MNFVREDIPCKLLSVENHPMEGFYVEINLQKTKWLLCCSYNSNRCKIDFRLQSLNRSLALYLSHYENFIIRGDFNVEANDSAISVFSNTYDLKALLKSQPAIRIQINLLALTLFWLTNREVFITLGCFSQIWLEKNGVWSKNKNCFFSKIFASQVT